MPTVIILAGPNGAGKSTLAARLVPNDIPFLNADNIARDRAAAPGPSADLAAGRILLRQLDEMEATRRSFAIETNLANRSLATRIPVWQASGYHVTLAYVWLPSADMCVDRVAARVLSGGHNIPEATIRRRYRVGLGMFLNTYRHLVDSWRIYNNENRSGAVLVARGYISDRAVWRQITQDTKDAE